MFAQSTLSTFTKKRKVLSSYELQRLENIAANQKKLVDLDIYAAAAACKRKPKPTVAKKRKTLSAPRPSPASRRSARVSGDATTVLDSLDALDARLVDEDEEPRRMKRRANNRPRPSAEQFSFLRAYAGETKALLGLTATEKTAAEAMRRSFDAVRACALARACLAAATPEWQGGCVVGWSGGRLAGWQGGSG